jgi:DNA-binding transcriptional MerR regulator
VTHHEFLLTDSVQDITFLSKKAGAFSSVPQRTVQAWTEAGLIIADTKGTGDRRRYSVLNCVEIGIVKSLRREQLGLPVAREIMDYLRKFKPSNLERLLAEAQGYLVIRFHETGRITPHVYGYAKDKAGNKSLMQYWRLITMPTDCEKVLVVNITRIAKKVLSKINPHDKSQKPA